MDIKDDYDFGFSFVESQNVPKLEKEIKVNKENIEYYYQNCQLLKRMFSKFLDDLMKDPGKDIHWPNRVEVLTKFKKEIINIADKRVE